MPAMSPGRSSPGAYSLCSFECGAPGVLNSAETMFTTSCSASTIIPLSSPSSSTASWQPPGGSSASPPAV